MNKKHHCNNCPHWYVTKKGYPSGFYNITFCKKYNEQIYYLAGEENQTPHPCNMCEKQGSYVSYINQEVLDVKRVTERLTEDFYDDMQKITRHCVKSDNIDLNCGGEDYQDIIDKLAEYEMAEEDGRMMIFPCKVGDVVYVTERRYYNYLWHTGVQKGRVYGFEYDKGWFIWVSLDDNSASSDEAYKLENFGKTVFLTYEEAEKVLEEMMKNNATN